MKVVINMRYGGFGLSEAAMREYAKRTGMKFVKSSSRCKGDEGYPLITDNHKLPDVISDKQWNSGRGKIKSSRDFDRTDPVLISVLEDIGTEISSGPYAKLGIVEIPDGTDYTIEEYDGFEHVAEKHRTWG